jgi:arsenate reductase (thioredoxin)
MIKPKVLFLCSGNSCRTQMAEAFLRCASGDHFEIVSAGNTATPLDPDAVDAMRELDIDISGYQTKKVDPYLGRRFTFVITLCDREQERTCPIFPGAIFREYWHLENPAIVTAPLEHRAVVRRVRDQLRERVGQLVSQHIPKTEKHGHQRNR